MEMPLDKKQIQAIFLFEFKMGHKAAEVNFQHQHGTAKGDTVQWWFKKFCKGDESLEDKQCSDQPSEVDNDKMRDIIEADPLIITVAKELSVDQFYGCSAFEANWKGELSLTSECFMC